MPLYKVSWEIDIDASDPIEAAATAFKIQQDPKSTASVFSVKEFDSPKDAVSVDVNEPQYRVVVRYDDPRAGIWRGAAESQEAATKRLASEKARVRGSAWMERV